MDMWCVYIITKPHALYTLYIKTNIFKHLWYVHNYGLGTTEKWDNEHVIVLSGAYGVY